MLLPENSLRRYVKVVMGLFIIVTLLVPMVSFLSQDESWAISAWQYADNQSSDVASVFSNGNNLSLDMREATAQELEKRLGRQVEAVVALVPGVNQVQAKVKIKTGAVGDSWSAIEWVKLQIGLTKRINENLGNGNPGSGVNQELSGMEGVEYGTSAEVNQIQPMEPIEINVLNKETDFNLNEGGAMGSEISSNPDDSSSSQNKKEIEIQVKNTVANFYGVPKEKIQVVFY